MADSFPAVVMMFALGLMVGFVLSAFIITEAWHDRMIERGLAQYCPTTGEWAWIGECEDD